MPETSSNLPYPQENDFTKEASPRGAYRIGFHFRLMLTSAIPAYYDRTYAALSYCWWRQKALQLTAVVEQTLLEGIPISRLPATIEAVQ